MVLKNLFQGFYDAAYKMGWGFAVMLQIQDGSPTLLYAQQPGPDDPWPTSDKNDYNFILREKL